MTSPVVKTLPTLWKTAQIHELLDLEWAEQDIVDKVFGERGPEYTSIVRAVRRDPHLYDTDIDEVAVARALEGDRPVWDGLTHYERREVLLAIAARRALEAQQNAEDEATVGKLAKAGGCNYKRPHDRVPGWFQRLADAYGLSHQRLYAHARDAAAARVL